MTVIINGKNLAQSIANSVLMDLRSKVTSICNGSNGNPHLVIYHLNELKSSQIYVQQKLKFAKKWNIDISIRKMDEFPCEVDILESVRMTNNNPEVSSIIVQLPLASNLNFSTNILDVVDPNKDVDALGQWNKQQLLDGCFNSSIFIPPTVYGVISLIGVHHELSGNKIGVVGQGPTLGQPCSTVFEKLNNQVIKMDRHTPNIDQLCSTCDIIIGASGIPNHIRSNFMKDKCGLVDGGAFDETDNTSKPSVCLDGLALEKAAWIAPSPGGLGPLTVMWLFHNVYLSYLRQQGVSTPTFRNTLQQIVSTVRKNKTNDLLY